jgi:hypothetical protein
LLEAYAVSLEVIGEISAQGSAVGDQSMWAFVVGQKPGDLTRLLLVGLGVIIEDEQELG